MLAPYLQYSMTELHDAGTSLSYAPASGQCLLFPGWLFHAVTTYRGAAPRISVAFNLDPVLRFESPSSARAAVSATPHGR